MLLPYWLRKLLLYSRLLDMHVLKKFIRKFESSKKINKWPKHIKYALKSSPQEEEDRKRGWSPWLP